jgi:hypothetical protein
MNITINKKNGGTNGTDPFMTCLSKTERLIPGQRETSSTAVWLASTPSQ